MKMNSHNDQGQASADNPPLAAHPLVPAIAALWLAAVLAIGAMMVPASLLERGVALLRLDQVVPAARPPLGFTARLLVAFTLALAGALAAFCAARRLSSRPVSDRATKRRAAVVAAADRAAASETAAAALAEDEEPDDLARLAAARTTSPGNTPPGNTPQRRRALTSETDDTARAILEISTIPALEPLAPAQPVDAPATAVADLPAEPAVAVTVAPAPTPSSQPPATAPAAPRFRSVAELGGEAALRICAAPLESLGIVQLVERFALAIHARRLRDADARVADGRVAGARGSEVVGATEGAAPAAARFADPEEPHPAPAGRPFDMPEEADGGPVHSPLLARPADVVPPAAATTPVAPPTPGADLARWSLPEPDGEGDEVADDLTPDDDESTYSSLLEMRAPARAPQPLGDFVRVEDAADGALAQAGPQAVVVFPGQAVPAPPVATHLPGIDGPASPVQTEQALREALAALQRMSGAA